MKTSEGKAPTKRHMNHLVATNKVEIYLASICLLSSGIFSDNNSDNTKLSI